MGSLLWLAVAGAAFAKKPVELGSATVVGPAGLCPGEHGQLELSVTDEAGKARRVKLGKNDAFEVAWELGEVGERGELVMPTDPRVGWGKVGVVTVTSADAPGAKVEGAVPLRFDCPLRIDLSGDAGNNGARGAKGASSPTNGTDGTDGMNGEDGHDAPDVRVRLVLVSEPRTGAPVLQAEITAAGRDGAWFAAVSPT
ncbi:MAG: hypothetical protein ABMB14_31450, partial [Myxococcota bacterium]